AGRPSDGPPSPRSRARWRRAPRPARVPLADGAAVPRGPRSRDRCRSDGRPRASRRSSAARRAGAAPSRARAVARRCLPHRCERASRSPRRAGMLATRPSGVEADERLADERSCAFRTRALRWPASSWVRLTSDRDVAPRVRMWSADMAAEDPGHDAPAFEAAGDPEAGQRFFGFDDDVSDVAVPAELPILPLRGVVIFPSAIVPLLISRGASLKLVEAALQGDRMLGLLAQKNP